MTMSDDEKQLKERNQLFEAVNAELQDKISLQQLKTVHEGTDSIWLPEELTKEQDKAPDEAEAANFFTLIQSLTIPEKIKLAMFGNQIARSLLIRDTNRQIPMFVLQNPRLTENEILDFAKNTNLDDAINRAIAGNSKWMKSYSIKLAIVSNPKTPIDVSLRWLKFMQDRDMRRLAKSKGIPQVVAGQCRKMLDRKAK